MCSVSEICKRGHVDEFGHRTLSSGKEARWCRACAREKATVLRGKIKDGTHVRNAALSIKRFRGEANVCIRGHVGEFSHTVNKYGYPCRWCRACARENVSAARSKNIELFRARDRRRYLTDPSRRNMKKKNRALYTAHQRSREISKIKQTCTCCSLSDFVGVYAWARTLGDDVDHRIPLILGGRHCVKNLQVLSKKEHKEKTSKDMACLSFVRKRQKLLNGWKLSKAA